MTARLQHSPPIWLFLMLVAGCVLVVGVEQMAYFAAYPGAWLLSIVLLAVTAIPAGVIIYRLDQFEPEPASLIAVAVMWGGVVALTFSAIVNSSDAQFSAARLAGADGGVVGRGYRRPRQRGAVQGAGLVVIYLMARREIDGRHGRAGVRGHDRPGFQVMENVQYFMLRRCGSRGRAAGLGGQHVLLRVVLPGLYSHMLFSGLHGFRLRLLRDPADRASGRRSRWPCFFAGAGLGGAFRVELALAGVAHGAEHAGLRARSGHQGSALPGSVACLWVFARRREKGCSASDAHRGRQRRRELKGSSTSCRADAGGRAALRRMKRRKGPGARALLKRLHEGADEPGPLPQRVEFADHPALEAQRDNDPDAQGPARDPPVTTEAACRCRPGVGARCRPDHLLESSCHGR